MMIAEKMLPEAKLSTLRNSFFLQIVSFCRLFLFADLFLLFRLNFSLHVLTHIVIKLLIQEYRSTKI